MFRATVRDVLAGRRPWGGSEPPLFFVLAAVPSYFLGIFEGTRLCAALVSSSLAFSGYLLAAELLGHGWWAVGAAAAMTFASPYLTIMMDLYKNCLALAILPVWLWAHLGLSRGRRLPWLLVAGVGLAASHLAVFAYALVLSAMAEILELGWRWGKGERPGVHRAWLTGLLVALGTLTVALAVTPSLRETAVRYWQAVTFSPQAARWEVLNSFRALAPHYSGLGLIAAAGLLSAFPWEDRQRRYLVAWSAGALVLAQPPVHLHERFALLLFPFVILWALHFVVGVGRPAAGYSRWPAC